MIGLGTCPPLQWLLTRQGTGSGGILRNTVRPGGAEGMICVCLSFVFVPLSVERKYNFLMLETKPDAIYKFKEKGLC